MKLNFCNSRREMGERAARDVGEKLKELLESQPGVRMLVCPSDSLEETLEELTNLRDIDWTQVEAIQAGEYTGASGSLGAGLKEKLFGKLPFGRVEYLRGDAQECARFDALLKEKPADIVILSIGANGSLAFNGPGDAGFRDAAWGKLAEADGAPGGKALTVSVPAILAAAHVFCCVAGAEASKAVRDAAECPVSEACPATALRRHADSRLYVDRDSARLIRV